MGQQNPKSTEGPPKMSETEILKEAQDFIVQHNICKATDDNFNWTRLILAKMRLYGHKHMLEHLKRCSNKLDYLQRWRSIKFEHLDHVFQNLIRSKITKSEEDQNFTKIVTHQKYSLNDRQQLRRITQRGEDIIRKKRVAVIIFVGNSSTKSEEIFQKQFYTQDPKDQCLFEIIMGRLQELGDKYGFPSTYLFYTHKNQDKVTSFLTKFKYADKIQSCMQATQPVLNLNGNICLKAKDSPDVIEMPNGSGDFYNTSIRGMGILQKMKMDGIEFVSCCDCQNMLESVIDPYIVGLLEANKTEYDLMYKCTYPQNQKDRIFRRIVLQNGTLKADTIQDLTSIATRNSKQLTISMDNIRQSPVWINSVVFKVEAVLNVIGEADTLSIFPQAVNYKMKNMNYWSPIDQTMRNNENCYVFQRQLSDLLINKLFKSKGIMVDRDEEYLPVITENKEYNWRDAYKEYQRKLSKNVLLPFYERVQPPQMMESLIRSDEYDHRQPN